MDNYDSLDNIINRLIILDEICFERDVSGEIVLLGGSGILAQSIISGFDFRPTRDIDVNVVKSEKEYEFMNILKEVGLDIVGGIMEVPPPEDLKCRENLYLLEHDFKSIKVFVPSIELLVCCKLFTKRPKDLIDLEESDMLNKCNIEKLMPMIKEYEENLLNQNDPFINIRELDRLFKEKGIQYNTRRC